VARIDRIELIIEGLSEDEGRLRLNTFMASLQSFSAALSKLDRESNNGKAATLFEVAELSFKSPVRVVVEPKSIGAQPYVGRAVVERLKYVTDALTNGHNLVEFDAELLEDIRNLARPVGKNVKSATVVFNGSQLDLTPKIANRVDEALAIEDECEGFLEGMLEQINIHQGANTFHIFPEIGPKKVTCHFSTALFDDAVSAVGMRVEVNGTLKYRMGANFPHVIDVSSIVPFPPESEIPDWDDIRGLAPDATGKLSSEAFIRELRDAWE
jgi:hypothetical protein